MAIAHDRDLSPILIASSMLWLTKITVLRTCP